MVLDEHHVIGTKLEFLEKKLVLARLVQIHGPGSTLETNPKCESEYPEVPGHPILPGKSRFVHKTVRHVEASFCLYHQPAYVNRI